jgi:diphthamide synthase (EF-2-diphthine--ammonia ligase)
MATAAERVLVSWSGGKDSCMALHTLRSAGDYEVVGLLTTVRQ